MADSEKLKLYILYHQGKDYIAFGTVAEDAAKYVEKQFGIASEQLSVHIHLAVHPGAWEVTNTYGCIWLRPYDSWEELQRIREINANA